MYVLYIALSLTLYFTGVTFRSPFLHCIPNLIDSGIVSLSSVRWR